MSIYGYTVRQEGVKVRFEVYRKDKVVYTSTVRWCDLSLFVAVFMCPEGSSKALSRQFDIAHKEGKKIVKLLEDSEKLKSGSISCP